MDRALARLLILALGRDPRVPGLLRRADHPRRRLRHRPGRHGRRRARRQRHRHQHGHQHQPLGGDRRQGFFRVPALEPGRYQVKAELSGFSTVEFKDIRLVSASEVTINPELKVAGVGEAITVVGRAEAIELNKTSATVGTTTMARQVVELPLSGTRNINNLIATSPNVNRTSGQGTFSANGQRSRNNNYMIDGSDNNDISVTIATTQVVPESVAEFQVQTNAYNVEFGRNSGAQVNVITKSGHQPVPRRGLGLLPDERASTRSQRREGPGPRPSRPGFRATRRGPASAGRSSRTRRSSSRSTSTTGSGPTRIAGRPDPHARRPSGCAALQNVPLRAGQPASSRQAILQRLSFLHDVYAQNPSFRNLITTTVNGVPIETRPDQRQHRAAQHLPHVHGPHRPPPDRQRQPHAALLLQQARRTPNRSATARSGRSSAAART